MTNDGVTVPGLNVPSWSVLVSSVHALLKRAGEEEWKHCMSVSVLLPDRKPAVTNGQKVYSARSIKTVCARTEHTDVNQVSKYTFPSSLTATFCKGEQS